MNIILPADQEHWLQTRIAKGKFQSAEDAVRHLIAERLIVDEARSAVALGDTSTLEESVADIDEVLRSLKS